MRHRGMVARMCGCVKRRVGRLPSNLRPRPLGSRLRRPLRNVPDEATYGSLSNFIQPNSPPL